MKKRYTLTFNSKPTQITKGDIIFFDKISKSLVLLRNVMERICLNDQDKIYLGGEDLTESMLFSLLTMLTAISDTTDFKLIKKPTERYSSKYEFL